MVIGAFTYGATKVLTDLVGKALKPKRAKDKVIDGLQDSTDKFDGLDPIEEGLAKANSESLPVSDVHFMQNSMKNTTGDYTVLGNAKNLAEGALDPNILRINVWRDDTGKIWTLDHRRLGAFKLSGLKDVPIKWAPSHQVNKQMWKMTTKTAGESIKLKILKGISINIR